MTANFCGCIKIKEVGQNTESPLHCPWSLNIYNHNSGNVPKSGDPPIKITVSQDLFNTKYEAHFEKKIFSNDAEPTCIRIPYFIRSSLNGPLSNFTRQFHRKTKMSSIANLS